MSENLCIIHYMVVKVDQCDTFDFDDTLSVMMKKYHLDEIITWFFR